MSDNIKTAVSRLAASPRWGYLVAFMREGEEMRVFKIRWCGCCFYSPIRCETVEILFNFIGGGLVCDLVSGLSEEEEEEGTWEGRIQGDAGRM
jgi:hypothetical protein